MSRRQRTRRAGRNDALLYMRRLRFGLRARNATCAHAILRRGSACIDMRLPMVHAIGTWTGFSRERTYWDRVKAAPAEPGQVGPKRLPTDIGGSTSRDSGAYSGQILSG